MPARRSRLRRLGFALLVIGASLGLGLLAAEGVLRRFLPVLGFERLAYLPEPLKHRLGGRFVQSYRHAARAYFAERNLGYRVDAASDQRYGLLPAPRGAPGPPTAARPFTVDALGFRNPQVPARADLLLVGDSFTTGIEYGAAAIFPNRAAAALGRTAYQAACGGWGPRQYHLAVEETAALVHPAWVVIITYLDNDVGDVWVYDGWRASPFETYAEYMMYRGLQLPVNPRRRGVDAHSVLLNLLRYRLQPPGPRPPPPQHQPVPDADRYRKLDLRPMHEVPRWTGPLPADLRLVDQELGLFVRIAFTSDGRTHDITLNWLPEDARSPARGFLSLPWWPPYAQAIAQTVQAAHAAGARPLLVLVPTRERVLAPAVAASPLDTPWPYKADIIPDGPARALASLADSLSADFLDLAPALRRALAAGHFGYAVGDIHFNDVGHAVVADALAARIRALEAVAGPGPSADNPGGGDPA